MDCPSICNHFPSPPILLKLPVSISCPTHTLMSTTHIYLPTWGLHLHIQKTFQKQGDQNLTFPIPPSSLVYKVASSPNHEWHHHSFKHSPGVSELFHISHPHPYHQTFLQDNQPLGSPQESLLWSWPLHLLRRKILVDFTLSPHAPSSLRQCNPSQVRPGSCLGQIFHGPYALCPGHFCNIFLERMVPSLSVFPSFLGECTFL